MNGRKKLIEVALPLEAINKASAREKSIRHTSPSRGGTARPSPRASTSMPLQGIAISAVQPRSRSVLSLIVPSMAAAASRPGDPLSHEPLIHSPEGAWEGGRRRLSTPVDNGVERLKYLHRGAFPTSLFPQVAALLTAHGGC